MSKGGRVCVVGGGVIGLSTALALTDFIPGSHITVIAEHFTPNTTSDGAFGLWEPHIVKDTPIDQIRRWGGRTFTQLLKYSKRPEASEIGTFSISGYMVYKSVCKDPEWADLYLNFRHMNKRELAEFGSDSLHGWFFTTVAAECRFYLPWLTQKLKEKGVTFKTAKIGNLSELADDFEVIVNCCGLGARVLVNDVEVRPVQGQVIRVKAPWVKHFACSEDWYILPGADSVVLGGTHVEDAYRRDVDLNIKKQIMENCTQLMPSLKKATVIKDWVGLRPSRTRVRLEAEMYRTPTGPIKVVHNYGHGGAGITLHWGCALDAADLVKGFMEKANL